MDKMSGTTAISVSFHGTQLIVANVGDSRAVMGHWVPETGDEESGSDRNSAEEEKTEIEEDETPDLCVKKLDRKVFPDTGRILAIPLSRDQTPYRKDERERLKLHGASIMSHDQMEGHVPMHEDWGDKELGKDVDIKGDPPRVWVKGKDYPGTAFTRSIGDSMAEDIGVTAEPETLARELTRNDHVLVIASDGIFEFLTNQEVIDMCTTCDSPLQACEKLVKAAYDKWLVHENRTDDITVIVCFLDVDSTAPADCQHGSPETRDERVSL